MTTFSKHSVPSLFISHGAPTFAIEPGEAGRVLTELGEKLIRQAQPRAAVVISAHWMTRGQRILGLEELKTIHDFGGFAPELYELEYPARGSNAIALECVEILKQSGIDCDVDSSWGLDHGVWVPLMHMWPAAQVPIVPLSLPQNMDSAAAWQLGKALGPLREKGVMIIGSGSITHNLRDMRFGAQTPSAYIEPFLAWIRERIAPARRNELVAWFLEAPYAQLAHPTDEHFLPFLVAAGSASEIGSATSFNSETRYGAISMESYFFS
jgi:4,5-DOPA dioxygenase extradiol